MRSLDLEFIDKVLDQTIPSFQLTCKKTRNLGFGELFYGFTRAMRPRRVVVIGSKAGFAPIMFAKALKDNAGYGIADVECEATHLNHPGAKPILHFIDPSYSLHRQDGSHWYGLGVWDDEEKVRGLWKEFGLEDIVTHFKLTSAEYLEQVNSDDGIDILYVDGDHSYEGVTHDFIKFHSKLNDNALVLAHDVDPDFNKLITPHLVGDDLEPGGGYKAYCDLPDHMYEKIRLAVFPGLAILRKKPSGQK